MNKLFKNIKLHIMMVVALLVMSIAAVACADSQTILLEVSHSTAFKAGDSPITRIAIANPDVADVLVLDNTSISIIGKNPGSTTLMVWSDNGMRQDFVVTVAPTDKNLSESIKASMNLPNVEVEKVGNKILLTGFVDNQMERDLAQSVAELYADSKDSVINKIQMSHPIQVNLSCMVLDINYSDANKYGVQYGNASKAEVSNDGSRMDYEYGTTGTFYGGQNWNDLTGRVFDKIDGFIQAVVTKNDGKVLSRPNVTTLSGEQANILIGGQLPVPTRNDGNISVQWKDYGIKLDIKPTVDTDGKITTVLEAEVSGIDTAHSVKTDDIEIPAITSRKVKTSVTIPSGSTMAIGGLINNDDSKIITKVPLLGDIPIIGEFFKHTSKSKERRELVILLTPTIVDKVSETSAGDKLLEQIENAKKLLAERKDVDLDAPPSPDGDAKAKTK